MNTIRLGRVEIASEPHQPRPQDAGAEKPPQRISVRLSPQEADKATPFTILTPRWLPEGVAPIRVDQIRQANGEVLAVTTMCRNGEGKTIGITQIAMDLRKFVVPDDIQEVHVGGRLGAFISHRPIPSTELSEPVRPLSLFWESGSFLLLAHAVRIDKDDVIRVAASVS